jgi:uncharacterized membrane protein YuzA (DUF378 family)
MSDVAATEKRPDRQQALAVDEFFYFFLRLRKNEVRRVARVLRERYPDESPQQLARRLVDAKTGLAAIGGGLLYLPQMVPGLGQALKLMGVVGAGSMLTRMHLYLILEIAAVYGEDVDDTARVMEMVAVVGAGSMLTRMHLYLILEIAAVYGEDIDDTARVMEMVAVVGATGFGAAAPQLLARFNLSPIFWVPAGALSMTLVTRLIGLGATRLYQARSRAAGDATVPTG